ncbi:phospholipid carrier-dependent glycosyltransferase [Solwaraspora sp. WMMD791]|uniref:dolichyl-phosphate-mannose--protein mannosyltransferase n=1 Tax=Solwaraspora sp. WMMD791 TaxID=3016086 RepID=UPI00249CA473|nr:glycosyltransferase family 39 protein [Solwaraspora sp. WMMD791]WFE30733.1 phospholipid carrier-dependent glycosyltransferase [Solwaraspora sp. WMMD791]
MPAVVRRRLAPLDNRLRPWSWLATAAVVLIAAVLRLVNLTHPPGLIFDEVYYANEGNELLQYGFEWDEQNNTPAYVVHPPLGKWIIALGIRQFGFTEFGWRIAAAVAGILMVLILTRTAERLFRSTVLGCTAGLLLALDGFHLVLSRTALLDIFLAFFVLAAFAALVVDRDWSRRRWLRAIESGLDPSLPGRAGRPPVAVPWWRLLAALLLGCGLAVKWSALWFIPVFGLLVVLWEVGLRRSVGARRPWRDTIVDEVGWLLLGGVLILATYIASWSGWLGTDGGYLRHYRADNGMSEAPVIGALQNLWHYHTQAYGFHSTLETEHRYQSWPWQWLLLGRPVAFYWSDQTNCGAPSCAGEVLLLGTPLLWWSFLPALAALFWLGIARRDWRAGAILASVAAGLLPWFYYATEGRTMFSFYTAPALPFLVLAVTYVLGAIVTPADARPAEALPGGRGAIGGTPGAETTGQDPASNDRRMIGAVIVGAYVLLVAVCFAYFYPIFVGEALPYEDWSSRMWLGGRWI